MTPSSGSEKESVRMVGATPAQRRHVVSNDVSGALRGKVLTDHSSGKEQAHKLISSRPVIALAVVIYRMAKIGGKWEDSGKWPST